MLIGYGEYRCGGQLDLPDDVVLVQVGTGASTMRRGTICLGPLGRPGPLRCGTGGAIGGGRATGVTRRFCGWFCCIGGVLLSPSGGKIGGYSYGNGKLVGVLKRCVCCCVEKLYVDGSSSKSTNVGLRRSMDILISFPFRRTIKYLSSFRTILNGPSYGCFKAGRTVSSQKIRVWNLLNLAKRKV